MKRIDKQHFTEQAIYIVLWIVVFFVPVIGDYYTASTDTAIHFSWWNIRIAWLLVLPFFLVFVANNYLLAPYLLFRKRYVAYSFSVVAVIVLLFGIYPLLNPSFHNKRFMQEGRPPGMELLQTKVLPPHPKEGKNPHFPGAWDGKRLFFMPTPPLLVSFAIAILLVGFNIAIKLMFKSLRDEQVLKELEHQRLQSELEYLKYQINPHFFMNTLNNIHALVDIDAAKAQKALVELSKLMRYVLYEANNQIIALSREVLFLNNYLELMKLRYIDKVNIEVSFPLEIPEVQIPPLLFISFVENAFKHGVSYQKKSFIRVLMELEGEKIIFRCNNSNWKKSDEQPHGIGLDNIRKRLRLLFGNDYTLSIDENERHYNVLLIIPLL